jgi:hypothetical protein
MEFENELKAGVSVTEMARMLGFSRSRCYQLIDAGILYPPVLDIQTRRPFFPAEIQKKNLEIRKRNMGANGKPILFYAQRILTESSIKRMPAPKRTSKTRKQNPLTDRLRNDLKSLGLDGLNDAQIDAAVRNCFPTGVNSIDEGEVLRCVYRYLKRQNSEDNVGR